MPKSVQGRTKTMIREMWQAPSLTEAKDAYDQFCAAWETKYPWRRLIGFKLIPLVMERRTFVDGELMEEAA